VLLIAGNPLKINLREGIMIKLKLKMFEDPDFTSGAKKITGCTAKSLTTAGRLNTMKLRRVLDTPREDFTKAKKDMANEIGEEKTKIMKDGDGNEHEISYMEFGEDKEKWEDFHTELCDTEIEIDFKPLRYEKCFDLSGDEMFRLFDFLTFEKEDEKPKKKKK
jgi:hypothetical protein